MPFPVPAGIIISISILLAAGVAVYENPQVQQWVENSRRKLAMALHSLGDELHPNNARKSSRSDPSMNEDDSLEAEERRRRARQEILEKGRILEEKRNGKAKERSASSSFDSIVDKDGKLRTDLEKREAEATTSALEIPSNTEGLTRRHETQSAQGQAQPPPYEGIREATTNSENSPAPLPQPLDLESAMQSLIDVSDTASSHPSESILDLTPTSEFPDPDFSSPGSQGSQHVGDEAYPHQSEYFSFHTSPLSEQSEFYYMHPDHQGSAPPSSQEPQSRLSQQENASSTPSIAGSMDHINHVDADPDVASIDSLSEAGDGVATPSSWTDMGSQVSSDGHD